MPTLLNRIFSIRGAIAIGLVAVGVSSGGFLLLTISSLGATLLLLAEDRTFADAEPARQLEPLEPTDTDASGTGIRDRIGAARVPGIHPDEPHRSASEGTSSTLRVLVCEDDSLVRNLVTYSLQSRGHTAIATEDARRALIESAKSPGYDALLTDIRLPGMSGHDLATELRKGRPDLPVVLMSGCTQVPSSHPLLQAPGTIMLAKPFRPADLQRALMEAEADARAHALEAPVNPNV